MTNIYGFVEDETNDHTPPTLNKSQNATQPNANVSNPNPKIPNPNSHCSYQIDMLDPFFMSL